MRSDDGRWLRGLRDRYEPSGILTTLDKPLLGVRVVLGTALAGPPLALLTAWGTWVAGEPEVAVVLLGFVACQVAAGVAFVVTGRTRLFYLLLVWSLLVASTLNHVVLGGYLWSGGCLLYGVAAAVGAALMISSRVAYVLLVLCLAVAIAMVPLEPVLRDRRSAPAVGLSLFILVVLYLSTLVLMVPPAAALVGRLRVEQGRSRSLMLNVLPASIADRLKAAPGVIADDHPACSIVFADLEGFTAFASRTGAEGVVEKLDAIFSRFDDLSRAEGAEKIKTIGDGYMAACGLPDPDPDHAAAACRLALGMRRAVSELNPVLHTRFRLRVGIHSGPVVAGVIGTAKFTYDVWGDTVNVASRLESTGEPGTISVSDAVVAAAGERFSFVPAGDRPLKGHADVTTYYLTGLRAESASTRQRE